MSTVANQTEKNVITHNPADLAGKEVSFVMPSTEELASLSSREVKFNLVTRYRTQEEWQRLEGVEVKCFYKGMKEIPNEDGELVSCGVFVAEDGVFISGQMMLMDAVKDLTPGTPIQITFIEKKKNKSSKGFTNIFDIKLLG